MTQAPIGDRVVVGNPLPPPSPLLRRHYVLPAEHGAWIWWIGPLLIGWAAAGAWSPDLLLLAVAALFGFLLRQPATIIVKVRVGRREARQLRPALLWLSIDMAILCLATAALAVGGHARVLLLTVPGAAVFVWHLWLVSRREERGQMGIEVVGAGVLALTAPAAYWVCGGTDPTLPWILWLLCWLQSAASIVLVYFRLAYRRLQERPVLSTRLHDGQRALLYNGFNAVLGAALALAGAVPGMMGVGFLLMFADAIAGVASPPIGRAPSSIGVRQLLASSLFFASSIIGFLAS